jgi:hypothetical protein
MVALGVGAVCDCIETPPHAGRMRRMRRMRKLLRNRVWRRMRLARDMRRLAFVGLNYRTVVYGATPP